MSLNSSPEEAIYTSQTFNHLGLVAQMCRELNIAETVNEHIRSDEKKVSNGDAVVAMIINGLGFTSRPLYLTPSFFSDKPVDRLVNPELTAQDLNANSLGRTLDYIFDYGPSNLFSIIAHRAVQALGLSPKSLHLDSSSFHLHGEAYSDQEPPLQGQELIKITKGYSRDHRPDLNQLILNMIVENQGSIPLWMAAAGGNSTDKDDFREIVTHHIKNLQHTVEFEYLVADSALYVEETLKSIAPLCSFITRVPATIKEVNTIYTSTDRKMMHPLNEDYSYIELGSIYGGIRQRWVVFHSKPAQQQAQSTFKKQFAKKVNGQFKAFKKLQRREFSCPDDAKNAVYDFQRKQTCLQLYNIGVVTRFHYGHKGRPKRDETPQKITYFIEADVATSLDAFEREFKLKGFFILATNQLDTGKLPAPELLAEYKGQHHDERGFKFLKSKEFLTDSFYLKSPARIEALLMVMTLCLMVYSAIQFRIRQGLQKNNSFVDNQLGKPIQNPTTRWIFYLFFGIHLLCFDSKKIVLNLKQSHLNILELLGVEYQKIYQNNYLPDPTFRCF